MQRFLSVFNLLKRVGFALLLFLLLFSACDKETEPESIAPEIEFFVEGSLFGAGDTVDVARGIEVGVGVRVLAQQPLRMRLIMRTARGDTLVDTTANQSLDTDTLRVVLEFAESDTLVWTEVLPEELPAPSPLVIKPHGMSVQVTPISGVAPLVTSTTVRVWTELLQAFEVDFENDHITDTTVVVDELSPLPVQTFVFARTYPVFDDTLKVRLHYRGSPPRESVRTVRIQSRNTPPQVTQELPFIYYNEDPSDGLVRDIDGNDASAINLNQYFRDLQSPIVYTAEGNASFAYLVQDSLLHLSVLPNQNSTDGHLTIIATDANNASTSQTLDYHVQAMTDLNLSIIDVENNQPLTGVVLLSDGTPYLVNTGQPVNVQVSPSETANIQAFRTTEGMPSSYLWTQAVPALEDNVNVTNIPVVTYNNIEPLSIDEFRQFNVVGRGVYIPSLGRYGLASWDFANANLDTIWIAHTGFPVYNQTSYTPTEAQKDSLEAHFNHMYNHIPITEDKQLVIHRAQPDEPLPVINEFGTPRDGILLANYVGAWPAQAGPHKVNGVVRSGRYDYNESLFRGASYEETMTCLGFVNDVNYASMPFLDPSDAVIHSNSPLTQSTPMENKAYTILMNTQPGLDPYAVFGTPPQQLYLPQIVDPPKE